MIKKLLIRGWEIITTSFWFLPLLIVVAAIISSYLFIRLDRTTGFADYPEFYQLYISSGTEGARAVLSTIASSMMTVAGIVFSITIVALTLASSQFGPRLLRNFMSDRINQVVLGVYVATYIYCLFVLRTVTKEENLQFIPHLSVLFAMLLAVANIILLIIYIHHISTAIQADEVIANVSRSLESNIEKLFPDEDNRKNEDKIPENVAHEKQKYPHEKKVLSTRDGYLQAVDKDNLLSLAKKNNLQMIHLINPGEFLVQGQPLFKLRCYKAPEEKLIVKLHDSFVFGMQRTPTQDPVFAVNQLVEIAVRALSPGINDPFTAMACIDKLGVMMARLTRKKFPSQHLKDDQGEIRLVLPGFCFADLMDASFDQIRLNGRNHASVLMRMMETYQRIAGQARASDQATSVGRHAEMVWRAGENALYEPNDLIRLRDCFKEVQKLLSQIDSH